MWLRTVRGFLGAASRPRPARARSLHLRSRRRGRQLSRETRRDTCARAICSRLHLDVWKADAPERRHGRRRGQPMHPPGDGGMNPGNRRVGVRRRLLWPTGATVGNRGYNVGNWGYCMGNKIHMVASVASIDWGA